MANSIYYASIPFVRRRDGTLIDAVPVELNSYRAATIEARGAVGKLIDAGLVVGAMAVSRLRDTDVAQDMTLVLTRFGETPLTY